MPFQMRCKCEDVASELADEVVSKVEWDDTGRGGGDVRRTEWWKARGVL